LEPSLFIESPGDRAKTGHWRGSNSSSQTSDKALLATAAAAAQAVFTSSTQGGCRPPRGLRLPFPCQPAPGTSRQVRGDRHWQSTQQATNLPCCVVQSPGGGIGRLKRVRVPRRGSLTHARGPTRVGGGS